MDYVVGSVAALISGNVTPNRPKLIRRALTPTKHQASPNVTPKSEFVEDRSIFLSPTLQKKKAIVKKSPKRIFENPDLDITENSDSVSPKADKVKKHLKNELEAEDMGKSSITKKSPGNKPNKPEQPVSPSKKSKIVNLQTSNENTPTKKIKRKSVFVSDSFKIEEMDVDQTPVIESVDKKEKSPKIMKRRKSVIDVDRAEDIEETETEQVNKVVEEPIVIVTQTKQEGKKKNKKSRKKNKQGNIPKSDNVETSNILKENKITVEETQPEENKTSQAKSSKKTKNRKKNKKPIKDKTQSSKEVEITSLAKNESDDENKDDDDQDESDEEVSNVANPNAITEKDTDSEHDSDDEIESENEVNNEVLKNDDVDDSSDDEKDVKPKKGKKIKKKAAQKKEDAQEAKGDETQEKKVNTEEEIRRTLFVGNVPFSSKCKKEIKKIFSVYGEIETVRIRTVPVKDARVTPKLAVIKNEIHPDRSTVNVYVKFADPSSIERALVENNTVLNNHHLRVSRSSMTGVEHDPHCAIFLGNLPFGIEDETLRAKFEKCGEIESVRVVRDRKTNAGKGFGYVNFASKDGVELALGLSEEDLTIKNRIIRVKRCTQTLSKGQKNTKPVKPQRKDFGNNQDPNRSFGNNQGQNRNFGNNQGQNRNFGNNQRSFGNNHNGNQGPNRNFGNNQAPSRNFGNNQGPNRNFGNNQGQNRNFGNNQSQNRNFGNNQGQNKNFGNNQGPSRNFGNNQGPRNFGNNQNRINNQGNEASGASRRIMNKRPHQESGDGPPNKKQNLDQPPRDKKQKKEFVGMTGEKKKKQKFDKNQKKKKVISEIMTKK